MQAEAQKNLGDGKAGSTKVPFRSDLQIVRDTGYLTHGFAAFYAREPRIVALEIRGKIGSEGRSDNFSRSYMTAGYLGRTLRALYTEVLPCLADIH